jgi:hypothetical protein
MSNTTERQPRERCKEAYEKALALDTSFLGAPSFQMPYTTPKQTGATLRAEYDAMAANHQRHLAEISSAVQAANVERDAQPITILRYIGAKFRAMEAKEETTYHC